MIGIALIPMGVVMFLKQYVSLELPLRDSVEATVAALIGMIPEGLYLLTSVALARQYGAAGAAQGTGAGYELY